MNIILDIMEKNKKLRGKVIKFSTKEQRLAKKQSAEIIEMILKTSKNFGDTE